MVATLPAIRCLILGDDQIDLTMMLQKYAKMSGLEYDNKNNELATAFRGEKCVFIAGNQENRTRQDVHVQMMCISVASQFDANLQNIKASLCSEVPFVVVGMEIEKRTEKFDEFMPMPENEAKKRAHLQGANTYVECSERTGEGIEDAFEEAFTIGRQFAIEHIRRRREAAKMTTIDKNCSDAKQDGINACITQ
ncbi:hypothetical protein WR25_20122 isoform A [Diploscapter pachys]|uniref:Ras family protein n=2 Tax=Diploscapter pachys TaxID=2018661 RepID=A0A2A2LZN1_9BILA|nr:hypothetical protein WR25_20122 isoform A [Diploscapter pachys]